MQRRGKLPPQTPTKPVRQLIRHPSESWGLPVSGEPIENQLGYPSFRWGDGLRLASG